MDRQQPDRTTSHGYSRATATADAVAVIAEPPVPASSPGKDLVQSLQSLRLGIIGLGYVGLPLAVEFGKCFQTVGFDISGGRIGALRRGFDSTMEVRPEELAASARLRFSSDLDDLRGCTVPQPDQGRRSGQSHREHPVRPQYRADQRPGDPVQQARHRHAGGTGGGRHQMELPAVPARPGRRPLHQRRPLLPHPQGAGGRPSSRCDPRRAAHQRRHGALHRQ